MSVVAANIALNSYKDPVTPETIAKRFARAKPANISEIFKPSAPWAARVRGKRRDVPSSTPICATDSQKS